MKTASGALILATFLIITGCQLSDAATDKIFCYYGSWAVHRPGNGRVDVEDIDPNLCTHVIYAFVGLTELGGVQILDDYNEVVLKALERFAALKKVNPTIKVLVSMGGWKWPSNRVYTHVVTSPTLRPALVNNVVAFLQKYNFDGFDLHWKYPGVPYPMDNSHLIELFKLFRQRFDQLGYILTASVGVSKDLVNLRYDAKNMAKYLHYILLMSYDMHDATPKVAAHNAPLYTRDYTQQNGLSVQSAVDIWLKNGATAESLVLGIPLHGRAYTLSSATSNEVSAPVSGVGIGGSYTSDMGTGHYSYLEICESLKLGGWTTVWDDHQKVPYSYKDNQWVGYEDIDSVKLKTNLAKDVKLGGVMIWSIESDDTKGVCGQGKYPLMSAIKEELESSTETGTTPDVENSTTETFNTETSTTEDPHTERPPTEGPPTGGSCTNQGRCPCDCNSFYMYQLLLNGLFQQLKFNCAGGLNNQPSQNTCDQ